MNDDERMAVTYFTVMSQKMRRETGDNLRAKISVALDTQPRSLPLSIS